MLIDTHTHLNDEQFNQDREEVISRAKSSGIDYMINIGYDKQTIETTIDLINKYNFIYGAIGWHPNNAHELKDRDLEWIEKLSNHKKVLAIGEIGLDYYWDFAPKDVQQKVFRQQIRLAKKLQMPIIIHNRDAHQDLCDILKDEQAEEVGGIMHSFSGSLEMAEECMRMGFYMSFSGPVTFKNAKKPKEVATHIPIDRILVETDAPYLTPEPYRGKRNEPAYVQYVAKKIAELRKMDIIEFEKITSENAKRILNF